MEEQNNWVPIGGSDSHCLVCGEIAVTWYYGAASCKPCHRFFRRISQKLATKSDSRMDSLLRCCLTGGKCRMEGEKERARCTVCRYSRCLQVGMRFHKYNKTHPSPAALKRPVIAQLKEKTNSMEFYKSLNQMRPTVIKWSPALPSCSSTQPSPPPSSPEFEKQIRIGDSSPPYLLSPL